MQSRREFFARLAVLCGAAAAVPIAAKALTSLASAATLQILTVDGWETVGSVRSLSVKLYQEFTEAQMKKICGAMAIPPECFLPPIRP